MNEFRAVSASHALPHLASAVLLGDEVGSRGGRVKEILHAHVVLTQPWRREILTPGRRASLPAQIAETMWVLAGRDDVEWLSRYLPRAVDFSDDGKVWRGAYGRRLRSWRGEFDQLAWVVDLLKKDPLTRRAVMSIYDPDIDSTDTGLDKPCNDFIQFQSRKGNLHMHVFIRSNDLMWGWSGINAFEWSTLQEIVAGLLGIRIGELHFSISSLHLYDRHWERAGRISQEIVPPHFTVLSPRFESPGELSDVDGLIQRWFEMEEKIRFGADSLADIEAFPEPMLRSWLHVIRWWWSKDEENLVPLEGTALHAAALYTPGSDPVVQASSNPFIDFVVDLHSQKSKVYGDSWKRRGERGILSNIARKVDRLGVAGGGDTASDTVVDLLVYCVLYRLWLENIHGDQDSLVAGALRNLAAAPVSQEDLARQKDWLEESFDLLDNDAPNRHSIVSRMIPVAAGVAHRLWLDEQRDLALHGQLPAGNATRMWNPDA